MRHRIASGFGLGNPDPVLLDNKGKKPSRKLGDIAIGYYFDYWGGFDFGWTKDSFSMGIEPAYQGEDLLIVTVHKDKKRSTITEGHAFGYYGSGIRKKTRSYKDYKYKSKFVKFVDEAHELLFGGMK